MAQNKDLNPQGGIQGSSALYKFNSSPNTRAVLSQKCRILTPAYGGGDLMYQIGVVSSFSAGSSSRDASEIRGVGFGDQVAELVPGMTGVHTLSFERALLYLSNAHQAFGYAGGIDGPVRTLQQHRWPFDVEQQIVFSSLADTETEGKSAEGLVDIDFSTQNATTDSDYEAVAAAQVGNPGDEGFTPAVVNNYTDKLKHKALITYFEGCWMTEVGFGDISSDGGVITQSVSASATDVHDLYSTYGEFMSTGNDPGLGQNSSLLYNPTRVDTARTAGTNPASAAANAPPPADA
jgi:hypothetical protein